MRLPKPCFILKIQSILKARLSLFMSKNRIIRYHRILQTSKRNCKYFNSRKRILSDTETLKFNLVTFLKLHQEDIASHLFDVMPTKLMDKELFMEILQINRSDYMKKLMAKTKPPKAEPGHINLLEEGLFRVGGGDRSNTN